MKWFQFNWTTKKCGRPSQTTVKQISSWGAKIRKTSGGSASKTDVVETDDRFEIGQVVQRIIDPSTGEGVELFMVTGHNITISGCRLLEDITTYQIHEEDSDA